MPPLIKSSYGYAVNGTCPFFSASDVLVAETTCDGKKKMYELMGKMKPLHLMHLPHTQEGEAPTRLLDARAPCAGGLPFPLFGRAGHTGAAA